MNLIKVKDHPNLYRDPKTKAIMVIDPKGRYNYQNQKAILQKTSESTVSLKLEVDELKGEIKEIKEMLHNLVHSLTYK